MKITAKEVNELICKEGEYAGYVWLAWDDEMSGEHYYPATPDEALEKLNSNSGYYIPD